MTSRTRSWERDTGRFLGGDDGRAASKLRQGHRSAGEAPWRVGTGQGPEELRRGTFRRCGDTEVGQPVQTGFKGRAGAILAADPARITVRVEHPEQLRAVDFAAIRLVPSGSPAICTCRASDLKRV